MGKKILIVDDSPTILMSMRGMLERAGQPPSPTAANGEVAVSVLKGGLKPDPRHHWTFIAMGAMDGIRTGYARSVRWPACDLSRC